MMVCNGLMWTTFTKALQGVPSTVEATVTNSSANLFFTVSTAKRAAPRDNVTCTCFSAKAVLGNAVFGETLSLQWWAGASLIVMGLVIIHSNAHQVTVHKDE